MASSPAFTWPFPSLPKSWETSEGWGRVGLSVPPVATSPCLVAGGLSLLARLAVRPRRTRVQAAGGFEAGLLVGVPLRQPAHRPRVGDRLLAGFHPRRDTRLPTAWGCRAGHRHARLARHHHEAVR